MSHKPSDLLARLNTLKAPELRRLLVERLTQQKLGLYWESDALERDQALNANLVFPRLIPELCQNSADPVLTPERQTDLFANLEEAELDELLPLPSRQATAKAKPVAAFNNEAALILALAERGVRAYPRTSSARNLPRALKREQRPEMADMSALSRNPIQATV